MAILTQQTEVQIEIAVRREPNHELPLRVAYGLHLLCNGRPPWNPALIAYGPNPTDYGWLWDVATPGPSLLELIETALREDERFHWQTRTGGIYLGTEHDSHGVNISTIVGIGSALLSVVSPSASNVIGWRVWLKKSELRIFAADLRREWVQLEI